MPPYRLQRPGYLGSGYLGSGYLGSGGQAMD
jgi:hypothetical protein